MSSTKKKCEKCKKFLTITVVELQCHHSFCSECIKENIKSQIKNSDYKIKCPIAECDFIIPETVLQEIINSKELKKLKKEKNCDICEEEIGVKLPCEHKYCRSCLKKEVRNQIGKNHLESVICIYCKKNVIIDPVLLQSIVGSGWLENYFGNCKECKKLIPKKKLVELRCNHKMCVECGENCKKNKRCSKCKKSLKREKLTEENQVETKCKLCRKYSNFEKITECNCGHVFCKKCLAIYLNKIISKKNSVIFCPKYNCNSILTNQIIGNILNSEQIEKYHKNQLQLEESDLKNQNFERNEETKEEEKKREFSILNKTDKDEGNLINKIEFPQSKIFNQQINESYKMEDGNKQNPLSKIEISKRKIISPKRNESLKMEIEVDSQSKQLDEKNGDDKQTFFLKNSVFNIEKSEARNYLQPKNVERQLNISNLDEKALENKILPNSQELQCLICKEKSDKNIIRFKCLHEICGNCLNKTIKGRAKKSENYEDILKCLDQFCNKILNSQLLEPYLEKDFLSNLENKKNRILKKEDKTFKCEKCINMISCENILTLECDHRFCKNCLKSDWNKRISEGNCRDLKCYNCEKDINIHILKGILSKEMFERYDNLILNQTVESKIKRKCPNQICDFNVEFRVEDLYIYCLKCKKFFCANEKCFGDYNFHFNISCEEYKILLKTAFTCCYCQKILIRNSHNDNYVCGNHEQGLIYFCSKCRKQYYGFSLSHKC